MKKIYATLIVIAVVVVGIMGALKVSHHQSEAPNQKSSSSEKKVLSSSNQNSKIGSSALKDSSTDPSNSASSTSSAVASSSSSSFKAQGELAESTAAMSSLMTADSGVAITSDMVREARQQLQSQGMSTGAFSDLDIAKIINEANDSSLDYKSAAQKLYPDFFE